MYKIRKRTIEFNSELGNLNIVERLVDEICDEYNISSTFFGNILIAVTEAVKNSIIFGNRGNREKKVILKFESQPAYLSFTVSDSGKGFDFSNIKNPTELSCDSDYSQCKGLYLIQSLSDIVKFYNNGAKIEMIFHISSINRELAVDRLCKINQYFTNTASLSPGFN
jgi:serine/threonine-protein kinase RsbW